MQVQRSRVGVHANQEPDRICRVYVCSFCCVKLSNPFKIGTVDIIGVGVATVDVIGVWEVG